jgi:hypothetical protein
MAPVAGPLIPVVTIISPIVAAVVSTIITAIVTPVVPAIVMTPPLIAVTGFVSAVFVPMTVAGILRHRCPAKGERQCDGKACEFHHSGSPNCARERNLRHCRCAETEPLVGVNVQKSAMNRLLADTARGSGARVSF